MATQKRIVYLTFVQSKNKQNIKNWLNHYVRKYIVQKFVKILFAPALVIVATQKLSYGQPIFPHPSKIFYSKKAAIV